jgi:hypothetical protein
MSIERRIHKRYCVKGLKSRLRISLFLGLTSKPTSDEFPCIDISESGLQFVTKKVFVPQSRLLLDISTPYTRNAPIRAKARVAWFKPSFDLDFYMVGVQFVSLGKAQHNELKTLVSKAGEAKDKLPDHVLVKLIQKSTACL